MSKTVSKLMRELQQLPDVGKVTVELPLDITHQFHAYAYPRPDKVLAVGVGSTAEHALAELHKALGRAVLEPGAKIIGLHE